MKRYSAFACALSICYSLTSASGPAQARKNEQGAPAQAQAQQASAARAQMQQARAQQEQAIRNQQAEARQVQQQQMRAQEESRQNQERALVAQEEQARQLQQQAIRAQQAQARQAQASMKAQQQQARQAQEEALRSQQAENRQAQQESRNEAKAQAQQERNAEGNQARQGNAEGGGEFRGRGNNGIASAPPPGFSNNPAVAGDQSRRLETANGSFSVNNRAVEPRAIAERKVPLQTAVSMPVLDTNATAQQRQHFEQVQSNLQNHLYAVPLRQAPANMLNLENAQRGEYFNNYRALVNNQQLYINRENTLCNIVAANEWPYWYQAEPNFEFCNSFTLGSSIQCGLDWLRWGWHPYYGPQPDGFVCANDYVPTPWVYYPAYGLWRQPGVLGWAPGGPPYDYTGPISVEVLEPRTVNVRDPYTGWNSARTINVIYMYNAFFYPDYDRWGYRNRHNYFIWVNV